MPDINPGIIVLIIIAIVSSLIRKNTAKMRQKLAEQEGFNAQGHRQTATARPAPPSAAQLGFHGDYYAAQGDGVYAARGGENRSPYGDNAGHDAYEGEGKPREYIPDAHIAPHDTHEGEAYDEIGHFIHANSALRDAPGADNSYNIGTERSRARFTPEQMRQGIIMQEILTRRVWTPRR